MLGSLPGEDGGGGGGGGVWERVGSKTTDMGMDIENRKDALVLVLLDAPVKLKSILKQSEVVINVKVSL